MKKFIIALVVSVALSGCATQTFTLNGSGGDVPDQEMMQPFFIGGLGQVQEMDAAKICGGADKVAKVETHLTFIDGLLGGLSTGLFTPRTARVYCIK